MCIWFRIIVWNKYRTGIQGNNWLFQCVPRDENSSLQVPVPSMGARSLSGSRLSLVSHHSHHQWFLNILQHFNKIMDNLTWTSWVGWPREGRSSGSECRSPKSSCPSWKCLKTRKQFHVAAIQFTKWFHTEASSPEWEIYHYKQDC